MQFAHWSFRAMALGEYPALKHDGTPFGPDDAGASLAGEPLGFAAAIIMVKGDWSEYVHAFGLPSWGTHRSPCLFCDCTGGPAGNIRKYDGTSATKLPWRLKDAASYEAACQACEVSVRVTTQDQLRRLALVCPFDKRTRAPGLFGRGLRDVGFGELGLTKGLRLERGGDLRDIGNLEALVVPPGGAGLELKFWDVAKSTAVNRRCCLFDGFSVSLDNLLPDELHTVYLGVFAAYCLACLWAVIEEDPIPRSAWP